MSKRPIRCNCENAQCDHCHGNGCKSRAHEFLRIDWIGEVCQACYNGPGMSQYYLETPAIRVILRDARGDVTAIFETIPTLRGIANIKREATWELARGAVSQEWEGSLAGFGERMASTASVERYFAAWFAAQAL